MLYCDAERCLTAPCRSRC